MKIKQLYIYIIKRIQSCKKNKEASKITKKVCFYGLGCWFIKRAIKSSFSFIAASSANCFWRSSSSLALYSSRIVWADSLYCFSNLLSLEKYSDFWKKGVLANSRGSGSSTQCTKERICIATASWILLHFRLRKLRRLETLVCREWRWEKTQEGGGLNCVLKNLLFLYYEELFSGSESEVIQSLSEFRVVCSG